MSRSSLLLLGSTLAISASFPAQGQTVGPNERRGPLSSLAVGLSLRTNGATPDTLRLKHPGDQLGAPPAYIARSNGSLPDYSLSKLFTAYPLIQIDAHSTGNDVIPVPNSLGVPNLTSRWLGITVSVDNLAQGEPNSLVRSRVGLGQKPGADLMSYYFLASVGLAPGVAGSTFLEQASEHIRFSNNEDVDAVDWALGVIRTNPSQASSLFFRERGEFYFSVSKTWADTNALTNLFFALDFAEPFPHEVPANGATIYVTRWFPVGSGGSWGRPEVHRSPTQLGLDEEVDDIDALAVEFSGDGVVFSTQPVVTTPLKAGRSQLLVHHYGAAQPGPFPLSDQVQSTTVPVTTRLGLRDEEDDIIGICTVDPEPESLDHLLGIPAWYLSAGFLETPMMGISTTRGYPAPGSADSTGDVLDPGVEHVFFQATGGDVNAGAWTFLLVSTNYQYLPFGGYTPPLVAPYIWESVGPLTHSLSTGAHATRTSQRAFPISGPWASYPIAVAAVRIGATVETGSWITFMHL